VPKSIVHWLLKVLFAAEISLGSEHRSVPQEKLNLFDFAARATSCCVRLSFYLGDATIQSDLESQS
jgi:hypothetical protein